MPDPYRTYRPGDPAPRDANTFNAFARAARAARDGAPILSAGELTTNRNSGIVRIKNETGRDLSRCDVVGLGDPIFTPSQSEDAFLREVTFRGELPSTSSHRGKFAILIEPAPIDRVVRAVVSGVCPARIDVVNLDHAYADVGASDTTALVSSDCGGAQILWIDPDGYYGGYDSYYGADTKWAIVRINDPLDGCKIGKTRGSTTPKVSGTTVSSSIVDEYSISGTGTTGTLTATGKSYRVFNIASGTTSGAVAANAIVGFSWRGNKYVFDWEDCGT